MACSPWDPTTVRTESPEVDTQHSAWLRDRRKRVNGQIPHRGPPQKTNKSGYTVWETHGIGGHPALETAASVQLVSATGSEY